jgi:hypothetical protein
MNHWTVAQVSITQQHVALSNAFYVELQYEQQFNKNIEKKI